MRWASPWFIVVKSHICACKAVNDDPNRHVRRRLDLVCSGLDCYHMADHQAPRPAGPIIRQPA